MKTFPNYDPTVRWNGDRCTVTLNAATKCGEDISAKSTVTRATKFPETDPELVRAAVKIAFRNLTSEHGLVVKACKRRGEHQAHG